MSDVDEHRRSGQETKTHDHSRLNEPPLVLESNLTTGLDPSEMISFSYEIILVHQAHAIWSTELGSKIQSIYTRVYQPNQLNELLLDVTYVYRDHVREHIFV